MGLEEIFSLWLLEAFLSKRFAIFVFYMVSLLISFQWLSYLMYFSLNELRSARLLVLAVCFAVFTVLWALILASFFPF